MTFGSEEFQHETNVSRETLGQFEQYEALLRKWNQRINLISPQSLGDVWHRHFRDSAQVFEQIPVPAQHLADFGSGAGFPGLVVAMLARSEGWDTRITLVESDQRKAAFLRAVAREVGLDVAVLSDRIEALPKLNADVISARALAPLEDLLSFCDLHLAPNGTAIFPKGRSYEEELSKALESWQFRCEKVGSKTDPEAVILKLTEIKRG